MDNTKVTMNSEREEEKHEDDDDEEMEEENDVTLSDDTVNEDSTIEHTGTSRSICAPQPTESPTGRVAGVALLGETTTKRSTAYAATTTADDDDHNDDTATSVMVINAGCARNVNTLAQSQLKSPLQRVQPILPEANAEVSSLEAPPLPLGIQQAPEAPRLPSGQEINAKNTLQSNSVVAVEATVTATTTATESAVPSNFYKQMHAIYGTGNGVGLAVNVAPVVSGAEQLPMLPSQQQPPPPFLPTSATSVSTLSAPVEFTMAVNTAVQFPVPAIPTTIMASRAVSPPQHDTPVFANACFLEEDGYPGCEPSSSLPIQSISPDSTTVVTSANSRVSGSTNDSNAGVDRNKKSLFKRRRFVMAMAITALAGTVVIFGAVCATGSCSPRSTASWAPTTNATPPASEETNLLSVSDYIQNVTLSGRLIAVLSSRTSKHELAEELALRWLMYEDPLALQPTNVTNRFRLRQRYALQTLFMRQHNMEEQQHNHSVSTAATNECEWLGVTCQTRELASGEGTFDMVTAIVLPAQELSGRLPFDLGLLSDSLMHLDVSHNNLYGSLPESFDQCTNMEKIDLSYNQGFVGSIPRSWGTQWTNLRNFSIAASDLTGMLPTELGQWTLLTHFNVEHNKLTGPIPSVWGEQWTKLEHFLVGTNSQDFSRINRLTGTIPEALSRWTSLRSFNVAWNSLVGTLPMWLQEWTALERFDVRENLELDGTLPAVYGTTWSSLRYADVSSNHFGGSLPESYSRWTSLEYLDINDNTLTGTLSESWAQWTNLRYLNVMFNQFRGSVPPLIGSAWSKLEFIEMGANQLVGSLPDSIGNWTSLLSFSANDNDLTGSLPSSIGQWTALTDVFNVDRNMLTGTLPASIGKWSRLTSFTVSVNGFTGTIPETIERWTMVESIFIEANNFTGTMPDGICQIKIPEFVADCQDGITCSCCTLCNSTLDQNYYWG